MVLTMQRQDRDLPAGTVVSSRQKGRAIMDKSGEQTIKYGVTPVDVMASMSGLDFVRAIFARRLPEPPSCRPSSHSTARPNPASS